MPGEASDRRGSTAEDAEEDMGLWLRVLAAPAPRGCFFFFFFSRRCREEPSALLQPPTESPSSSEMRSMSAGDDKS